ncbi:MAG: cell division protein ZapA [Alphaproteobacteria bacterium]|nr:cell division protein ZapA [Alphaproteobacteria bacterium]
MSEVNISINGRKFGIMCDSGQEQRVTDLAYYIDTKVKELAHAGAGTNENHLLVLASLMMADELFDLKDKDGANAHQAPMSSLQITEAEENAIVDTIDQMANRIQAIATNLQKAV